MYKTLVVFACCVALLSGCATVQGGASPEPGKLGSISLTRAEYAKVRQALVRRRQRIRRLKAELLHQKAKAKAEQEKVTKALRIRLSGCNKKLAVKCPPPKSCVLPMVTVGIVVGVSALVAGAVAGAAVAFSIK